MRVFGTVCNSSTTAADAPALDELPVQVPEADALKDPAPGANDIADAAIEAPMPMDTDEVRHRTTLHMLRELAEDLQATPHSNVCGPSAKSAHQTSLSKGCPMTWHIRWWHGGVHGC